MRFRPFLFILIALLSQLCFAEVPVSFETYTLHAKEERENGFSFGQITLPGSVVLLDHEHSLLVLIPQADGAWVLKRLNGWDTTTPTEDTLEIIGEQGQGTTVSIDTDLRRLCAGA